MCGENRCGISIQSVCAGSPPRVRGKPTTTRRGSRPRGITPACAGKTSYGIRSVSFNRDHPRVCGENLRPPMSAPARIGSPPRVRGKQAESFTGITLSRITPACAGKTKYENGATVNTRDHPRVCGENFTPLPFPMMVVGSPPRVRGKRSTFPYKKTVAGITPACAGKTRSATG